MIFEGNKQGWSEQLICRFPCRVLYLDANLDIGMSLLAHLAVRAHLASTFKSLPLFQAECL